MSPVRSEIRTLAGLALPVAATQVAMMMMNLVDSVLLGHLSVQALGAAAIANVWIWGTLQLGTGVIYGIDPIVAQAHGAGDGRRAALALQRGIALSLLAAVPVALLWNESERFLLWTGQDPELARQAAAFTRIQIPSIPFTLCYFALRQYLQGRGLMRPALVVVVVANVLNAGLAYSLIFGSFGAPALGLIGAGIATAIARAFSLGLLVLWVWSFALHRGAWVPWSRAALEPRALGGILAIGIPVAIQISLEFWAFSGATLLSGWLGTESLAAHTIALNLAALSFMMPLGISQAAVTRVGNLIGAERWHDAQRAAWVAFGFGAGVMAGAGLLFVALREALPRIYTPDPGVIALVAAILPIAAAFQIFDGAQVVGFGIMRGMGRTRPAAFFNLVGYWLLGLPLGAWLAFRADMGLAGIWWGLCFGLALISAGLLVFVRLRGPASLAVPAPANAPAAISRLAS